MTQDRDEQNGRIELTSVQIRKGTHRRLKSFRDRQLPRPSLADLATVAIEEYLDRVASDQRRAELDTVKGER